MSNNNKKPKFDVKPPIEHITQRGYTIRIMAVPPYLLDRIDTTIQIPDKPTYTAVTAGGETEIHDHDETTLETDEEKREWAEYISAIDEADRKQDEMMMKVLILEGIEVDMSGEKFEQWKKRQIYYGLEIPEDEFDLKIYFVETEILAGLQDLGIIMSLVMTQSGLPQEVADQALDSFQAGIQRVADSETPVETGQVEA